MRGLLTILRNARPMRVMNAEIACARHGLSPRFSETISPLRKSLVARPRHKREVCQKRIGEDIPFVSRTLKPSSGLNIALGTPAPWARGPSAHWSRHSPDRGFSKPIRSSWKFGSAITVGVDPAEERLSLADVESSGVQTPGPRL